MRTLTVLSLRKTWATKGDNQITRRERKNRGVLLDRVHVTSRAAAPDVRAIFRLRKSGRSGSDYLAENRGSCRNTDRLETIERKEGMSQKEGMV